MNETAIVKIEEHRNEKVVSFYEDCMDPETEAWNLSCGCQYLKHRFF